MATSLRGLLRGNMLVKKVDQDLDADLDSGPWTLNLDLVLHPGPALLPISLTSWTIKPGANAVPETLTVSHKPTCWNKVWRMEVIRGHWRSSVLLLPPGFSWFLLVHKTTQHTFT